MAAIMLMPVAEVYGLTDSFQAWIVAGDADVAEREIVADVTEVAQYLEGLADASGQLRRPTN
jgi:hypothetical protein